MSAPWNITNTSTAGVAATAAQAAPTNAGAQGQQTRLRSIEASLAGSGAGSDTLQVLDGVTVIFSIQLSIAANGYAQFSKSGMDLRASLGNTLTVAFVSGVSSDIETVNAQGDFVPQGYPAFQN